MGLKLPTLRQRLFRCVSIRENDDGTYAITAVQHVPEKEAIVDNGAHFDGDQSGTVNGVTPPAVQHLTAEVTADSGEYQVLARWDTPKVVKGVSFLLRLTVAADDAVSGWSARPGRRKPHTASRSWRQGTTG